MSVLLDTHVFLWWASGRRPLAAEAQAVLADARRAAYVSAASAWEASIKIALGKLSLDGVTFSKAVEMGHLKALPVTIAHAEAAAALPPHHLDPFDRLLVSQALVEGMTLITHDQRLAAYDVPVIRT